MASFVTIEDIKNLPEGQHSDQSSQGLYIQVRKSERTGAVGASWLFRWKPRGIGAKTSRAMGIGPFDARNAKASLESARRRAAEIRDIIARGDDPVQKRAKDREEVAHQVKLGERPTFLEYAKRYVETREAEWKNPVHRQQWRNTLGIGGAGKRRMKYCDSLHSIKVDKIDTAAVRRVLDPIWTVKVETARRLRGRIEAILDAAEAEGFREGRNPAAWKHLRALGYAPKDKLRDVEHHPSLNWKDVPAFMVRLREKQGIAARCVELVVLTATRSQEARMARWSEIDLDAKRWTIPGGRKGRMKKEKPHAVPLSEPVIELLKGMEKVRQIGSAYVFPGLKCGTALSDTSLRNVLRDLGIEKEDASIHGMRASLRTWAGEATNYPRDAMEHALAHSLPPLDAAYFRSDMYAARIKLMTDWAAYCSTAAGKAKAQPAKARVRTKTKPEPDEDAAGQFFLKVA
jgi:integrase